MSPLILIRASLLIGALISIRSLAEAPQAQSGPPDKPEKITVCQLKSDPAKYNHKLVEVTGFISHGFEDFDLGDPTCAAKDNIWLDYGGTKESNTMYCCGVTPGQTRPQQVSVENISIPLVDDGRFKEFDKIIRSRTDMVVHGTIVGRFFSGQQAHYSGGVFWSGYGHMGCCMLMMIQQVLSVDSRNRDDLDYGASPDQPNVSKAGCGYKILKDDEGFSDLVASQRRAESGERGWAFDEPKRVATESLARLLKIDEGSITPVKLQRQAQGRIVYHWKHRERKATYMVVVSRPYMLSFYANSNRVAWVTTAAYELFCGEPIR